MKHMNPEGWFGFGKKKKKREEEEHVRRAVDEAEGELEGGYTEMVRKHLASVESPLYEEQPSSEAKTTYHGKPVIGMDSPINGGVYMSAFRFPDGKTGIFSEVLEVDDSGGKHKEIFDEAYFHLVSQVVHRNSVAASKGEGNFTLQTVLEFVQEHIPYDLDKTHEYTDKLQGFSVPLTHFIEERYGVCRHQSLFAAYLIERMIKDGRIKGKVSIDRKFVRGKGGHAWVRFTSPNRQIIIMDPASGFLGTLEEAEEKGKGSWSYKRPDKAANP